MPTGKSGLSSPQRAFAASRCSAVMCGLRGFTRSGEPGIIRNRTKLRSTMKTIVTIACSDLAGEVARAHERDPAAGGGRRPAVAGARGEEQRVARRPSAGWVTAPFASLLFLAPGPG